VTAVNVAGRSATDMIAFLDGSQLTSA